MSGTAQVAVVAGLVLLLVHVSLRRIRLREARMNELFEIVCIAMSTLLLPSALKTISVAPGRSDGLIAKQTSPNSPFNLTSREPKRLSEIWTTSNINPATTAICTVPDITPPPD